MVLVLVFVTVRGLSIPFQWAIIVRHVHELAEVCYHSG
jgi:hypothetical protein